MCFNGFVPLLETRNGVMEMVEKVGDRVDMVEIGDWIWKQGFSGMGFEMGNKGEGTAKVWVLC